MLRHIFKLVWKRKSRNLMLSAEILLAFVVVFAIAALGVRSWQFYHTPLGFQWADSWRVAITSIQPGRPVPLDTYERMRTALLELPDVEAVASATFAPFTNSGLSARFAPRGGGAAVKSNILAVSDGFTDVSGIRIAAGRNFSRADDGAAIEPVVVTRGLADALFPGQQALDKVYRSANGQSGDIPTEFRIVGVIEHYRPKGEFQRRDEHYMLTRLAGSTLLHAPEMVVKLRPGTSRAFEEKLVARLKQVRGDWDFEVTPLEEERIKMMQLSLIPLAILSVVAAFLLVMVGFGLFGVLWQNTTRRIPEFGLRRALGANAGDVYRLVIGEQLMLSSFAMAVGLALLVQLPLTGVLGSYLDWTTFAGAALLSMAVIYLISLLCALYPGWRASRLTPTEALHQE